MLYLYQQTTWHYLRHFILCWVILTWRQKWLDICLSLTFFCLHICNVVTHKMSTSVQICLIKLIFLKLLCGCCRCAAYFSTMVMTLFISCCSSARSYIGIDNHSCDAISSGRTINNSAVLGSNQMLNEYSSEVVQCKIAYLLILTLSGW